MKILFINKFLDKHTIYRVPLGILYLSACLKKAGHEVHICEASREDVDAIMRSVRPEIVAYSLRTGFHKYFLELNRRLKGKFDFFSIFGGPHPTFFPEMIEEEGVDCIALSECEEALVELLNMFHGDFRKTKNFWFKYDGIIIRNPVRELEQNLDAIPFPDRGLLDKYVEIRKTRIHNFLTSRGCPYNCSYCFNHQLKKIHSGQRYVRRRSVDNVLEEIRLVAQSFFLERVHFEDDTFNIDKKWLREFVEKYPKIPFKCNIRANLVDDEVVRLLKEANCISVTFAIEAGNERIRNEVLNRNMSRKDIVTCAALLKKHGIRFITENILAAPTSELEDDFETLDLNLECRPDYPTVSLLQPYPRTEVFRIAVENKQFEKGDINKLGSFFKGSPLDISQKGERANLQKLFAIVIAFPFLRKYIAFLIKQEWLGPFYTLLYSLWRPYCLVFKIMPHRLTLREVFWLARRYITS